MRTINQAKEEALKNHQPKLSFGQQIIQGLQEFTEALEKGEDITKKFRCHTICLDLAPQPYNAKKVKYVRNLLEASQTIFARLLGVSVKTVRSWEQGINTPSGMACRFMDEIQRDPQYWIKRLQQTVVVK